MVPVAELRAGPRLDAAIAREQHFMSTLGAWAAPEELKAHEKYLGELVKLRESAGTPAERLDRRERQQRDELRAQLVKLGDTSGCRDDDTVASLTTRVQALTLAKARATDEKDAERLNMGLDGRAGTRSGLDDYETTQWAAAVNPGSGTGVVFAAMAAMRGGSLDDVRAAGQAGNQLEDLGGGVGHVLNQGRRPLEVETTGARAKLPTQPMTPLAPEHAPTKVKIRATEVRRVDDFNAGGTLPTKPMLDIFASKPGRPGEAEPGNKIWPGKRVEYLSTPSARAPFKLEVREVEVDGRKEMRLFDSRGAPFDTRAAATHWSSESGVPRAIFVMNSRGELFASNYQERGKFHHSSLAGGQAVAAAGELQVTDGKIVDITNNSGHYRPGDDHTQQLVDVLQAKGVDLRGVTVVDVGKQTTRQIR
jgi:hypothetical protein